MSILRIAVAQINSVLGNIEENVRIHLHYIEEAKAKGVQLLLFPELSLTGYKLGAETINLAVNNDAPQIQAIARHADPNGEQDRDRRGHALLGRFPYYRPLW